MTRDQIGAGVSDDIYEAYANLVGARQEYPGEKHAVTSGKTANFLGPGTHIRTRLARGDKPVNDLDNVAKSHDISYMNSLDRLKHTNDKKQFRAEIWKADNEFIDRAKRSKDDPVVGKVASGMIAAKMYAEKAGLMSTRQFSGAGRKEKPKLPEFVRIALNKR
jgi:hypothetical protein